MRDGFGRSYRPTGRVVLYPGSLRRAVNQTALLHIAAAITVGAAIFVPGQTITAGLLVVGVLLFAAGIVIARRDGNAEAEADVSD